MQAQTNFRKPLCIGLLAHVWAGRGVPHFYSPEKFEFLRAFLFFTVYFAFN